MIRKRYNQESKHSPSFEEAFKCPVTSSYKNEMVLKGQMIDILIFPINNSVSINKIEVKV